MVTRKTTSKTTSRKVTTSRSKASTAKAAPKPTAAPAEPVAVAKPIEAAPGGQAVAKLRKRELFNRVKARSTGVKGSDVRLVMDALLDELGTVLVQGDTVDARPLGVLKVQRHKPITGGDIVVCKLRRKKPAPEGKDPLAEAAE